MKTVKDTETKAIFNMHVIQDNVKFDTDTYSEVCDECAKKYGLLDSYLELNSASGLCGIVNCHNSANHYYNYKRKENMFNFDEKQGRLVIEISLFLENNLDNKELEKVFNELKINIKHNLVSDIDINPVT